MILTKCRHCNLHTFQIIKTYTETFFDETIPFGVEYERKQVICQHCESELANTDAIKQENIDSLTGAILQYHQEQDAINQEILNSPLQDCSLQHEVLALMSEICVRFDQLNALGCYGALSPEGILEVTGLNVDKRPFTVTMSTDFSQKERGRNQYGKKVG